MPSVVIVGGGLSALACAVHLRRHYLSTTNAASAATATIGENCHSSDVLEITIIEARDRLGGRLWAENGVDLGAAWSWTSHDNALQNLIQLSTSATLSTAATSSSSSTTSYFSDAAIATQSSSSIDILSTAAISAASIDSGTSIAATAVKPVVELIPQQSRGLALAQTVDGRVVSYGQDVSPSGHGSVRFRGSTSTLVAALVNELNCDDYITDENSSSGSSSGSSSKSISGGSCSSKCRVRVLKNTVVNKVIDNGHGEVFVEACNSATYLLPQQHQQQQQQQQHQQQQQFKAAAVVLAMPPKLIAEFVEFLPPLPDDKIQAMKSTPTWMENTGKVGFIYEAPFWRKRGFSGTVFSQCGPLQQIWDNSDDISSRSCYRSSNNNNCNSSSNSTSSSGSSGSSGKSSGGGSTTSGDSDLSSSSGSVFALAGFVFDGDLRFLADEATILASPILQQLTALFGAEAATPQQIVFKSWQQDPFTSASAAAVAATIRSGRSSCSCDGSSSRCDSGISSSSSSSSTISNSSSSSNGNIRNSSSVIPFGSLLVRSSYGSSSSNSISRIIFAGTETAANESGHMNGAVVAGIRAATEAAVVIRETQQHTVK